MTNKATTKNINHSVGCVHIKVIFTIISNARHEHENYYCYLLFILSLFKNAETKRERESEISMQEFQC